MEVALLPEEGTGAGEEMITAPLTIQEVGEAIEEIGVDIGATEEATGEIEEATGGIEVATGATEEAGEEDVVEEVEEGDDHPHLDMKEIMREDHMVVLLPGIIHHQDTEGDHHPQGICPQEDLQGDHLQGIILLGGVLPQDVATLHLAEGHVDLPHPDQCHQGGVTIPPGVVGHHPPRNIEDLHQEMGTIHLQDEIFRPDQAHPIEVPRLEICLHPPSEIGLHAQDLGLLEDLREETTHPHQEVCHQEDLEDHPHQWTDLQGAPCQEEVYPEMVHLEDLLEIILLGMGGGDLLQGIYLLVHLEDTEDLQEVHHLPQKGLEAEVL